MTTNTHFLQRGLALVTNGYQIIPIRPGEKRPGEKDWQHTQATPTLVKKWSGNGYANGNLGILTATHPAIDLDIYDADVSQQMADWCLTTFGDAPLRVGQAPKKLLMYHTTQPFTKLFSEWRDQFDAKHKVEILGDGQQFVAYGIHPDTKQPYQWLSADQPTDTPCDFVPELTRENALRVLDQFDMVAKAAGWTFVGRSDNRVIADPGDDSQALMTLKPKLKLSMPEILHTLEFVDQAENYDRWLMVGMALHHQSGGKPAGLDVWDDWSRQAHNYSDGACAEKWQSFHAHSTRNPVTFASVLKIANTNETAHKAHEFERVINQLQSATTVDAVFGMAKQLSEAITEKYQWDMVAKKMQDRAFEISNVRLRIEVVRQALMRAKVRDELATGQRPAWAQGWVYLLSSDRFYHIDSKKELTQAGFNAQFNRQVVSDDNKELENGWPACPASAVALNLFDMPCMDQKVYLPGHGKILELNGRNCVNTYNESSMPLARRAETTEEKHALSIVENHFAVLLPDELERNQVLDFLSYSVQFPAEKIVWGIVMQGAEGAGKTALLSLMSCVMGEQNISPLSATELHDKYTGWGENKKMVFIEEIRLHNSSRYEILDKLKPYIANNEVTIRRMNNDAYVIPNVTNYFMFTNSVDALPVGEGDRRYYVVSTAFQTKSQMVEWNTTHPRYFTDLYAAIQDHPDVLRHWLLNRELSPVFQPKRPALDSAAKTMMRDQAEYSDESDAVRDLLETSTDPEISYRLLNAAKLRAALEMTAIAPSNTRAFGAMLRKMGFVPLGQFRVDGRESPKIRFYTMHPQLFKRGHELDAIRAIQNEGQPVRDHFADVCGDDVDPFA